MDKTKDLYEELTQEHGKLKWVANVEKDDESVRLKGHIVGPPKADDQYSAEELDEMGVIETAGRDGRDRTSPFRRR